MSTTLFTIGYEGHPTPGSMVTTLQGADVERLLDVRELPLSRRRGFSKTLLSATLAEHGIRYDHERGAREPQGTSTLRTRRPRLDSEKPARPTHLSDPAVR